MQLGWDQYQQSEGTFNAAYISQKQSELAALRAAGFNVVLSLGTQYEPSWLKAKGKLYVDQYGDSFNDASLGAQTVDMVFDASMRAYQKTYIDRVFADFGTNFAAVRIGGGHLGELSYPANSFNGHTNAYWAYSAAANNPVPGWHPGDASPSGQASTFVNWYLDSLTAYETWQISTYRADYPGTLMLLLPSFGVRPGQLAGAIAVNLNGSTSVEQNGELQRGYDYAREIGAITDSKVWPYSTWMESRSGNDGSSNPGDWNPVGYISYLANANPLHLKAYGENAGQDSATDMAYVQSQANRFGLQGYLWFQESELFSGQYATLQDYANVIASDPGGGPQPTPTPSPTPAPTPTPSPSPTPSPTPASTLSDNIANGATLSGNVTWTATVSPAASIDFLIDGVVKWTELYGPWQYNGDPNGVLDTTTLTNGSHTLAVRSGSLTDSETVTVSNAGPTPTPVPTPTPTAAPGCPANIQTAIDGTATNGTLNIAGPCVYNAGVTISRAMTVTGNVTLDGGGTIQYGIKVTGSGVTVDGWEVRHFNNPVQDGAIHAWGVNNLTVANVHSHDNMGACISFSTSSGDVIRDSEFDHCDQQGYHGSAATNFQFLRNKIHDNNLADHWDPGWEAGGGKTTRTRNGLFDGNESWGNHGPGMWCDIDCETTTFRNNKSHDNTRAGIFYEISYTGQVYSNSLWGNTTDTSQTWGYAGQLLISSNGISADVHDNVLAYSRAGIAFISQVRNIDGNPITQQGQNMHAQNNTAVATGNAVGWYQDDGQTWPGKIDSGNVYYPSRNAQADAILTAAGIPLR